MLSLPVVFRGWELWTQYLLSLSWSLRSWKKQSRPTFSYNRATLSSTCPTKLFFVAVFLVHLYFDRVLYYAITTHKHTYLSPKMSFLARLLAPSTFNTNNCTQERETNGTTDSGNVHFAIRRRRTLHWGPSSLKLIGLRLDKYSLMLRRISRVTIAASQPPA